MATIEQAKQKLSDAFGGITPAQQAAIDRVERAFAKPTVVNARDMEDTQLDVPTGRNFDFSNAALDVGSSFNNLRAAADAGQITEQDIQKAEGGVVRRYLDLIAGTSGKAERKQELFEESSIAQDRELAADYTSQLESERLAIMDAKEALLKNPEGLGAGALNARIADLERNSLAKQARIAVLGNAANRSIEAAQANIQSALDLEFGQAEEDLRLFEEQVSVFSPYLGELSSFLKEKNNEKKEELEEQRDFQSTIMGLAAEASANGNPTLANSLMARINTGQPLTFEDVTNAQQSFVSGGGAIKGNTGGASIPEPKTFAEFVADTPRTMVDPRRAYNLYKEEFEQSAVESLFGSGAVDFSSTDIKKIAAQGKLGAPISEQLEAAGYAKSSGIVNPFE